MYEYIPEEFENITNCGFNFKPCGGLWTSPIDSEYGWIDYINDKKLFKMYYYESNYFDLEINTDKILKIDSLKDIMKLPLHFFMSNYRNKLNFENITKEYDAFWLTYEGMVDTKDNILKGWDCETILLLNKNCIKKNYKKLKNEYKI